MTRITDGEMIKINDVYHYLLDNIASEETINAIIGINGYTLETLNDILYYFTGYRDLKQLQELED